MGATFYYIGDNLPQILSDYSTELNCDEACVRRGFIAGVYFLFIALTTFNFLPTIFRRVSKTLQEDYEAERYLYARFQFRFFVLRMLALLLDFDAIYTACWVYAFIDVENCGVDEIVGSSITILTGWITWSIYAIAYAFYLPNVASTLKQVLCCKLPEKKHRVLNGIYYATMILLLVTIFPLHILGDNTEPIECGCTTFNNATIRTFTCQQRRSVNSTRLAIFFYQLVLIGLLGSLGTAKFSLEKEKTTDE